MCDLASQRQFSDGSLKAHGFQRGEKMLGTDPSHVARTSVDRSSLSPYLPPRAHALHTTLISPLSRVFMLSTLRSVVSRSVVRRPAILVFFVLTEYCVLYFCGRLRQNHRPDSANVRFVLCHSAHTRSSFLCGRLRQNYRFCFRPPVVVRSAIRRGPRVVFAVRQTPRQRRPYTTSRHITRPYELFEPASTLRPFSTHSSTMTFNYAASSWVR